MGQKISIQLQGTQPYYQLSSTYLLSSLFGARVQPTLHRELISSETNTGPVSSPVLSKSSSHNSPDSIF
ncbi:MAG: hypothetical protein ACYDEF_17180 [Methanosarcina sp.]